VPSKLSIQTSLYPLSVGTKGVCDKALLSGKEFLGFGEQDHPAMKRIRRMGVNLNIFI